MAALLMRRDEAFVQAVEELKMEKPTKLGAAMLRRSRSFGLALATASLKELAIP
ncbi:hypothetical protein ACVWZ6_004688 [Bradyrhizobium sp. GM6.1]